MRLIDADALKEEFDLYTDRNGYLKADPEDLIDNAPTIKTFTLLDIEEQYRKGLEKVLSEWETERPQGEWIPCYVNFTDGSKPLFAYCKCSLCNKQATGVYKFCPNCGAEMKKGENNGSD